MYDAHIKAWKQDNRIARREALARYSAKVRAAHKAAPVADDGPYNDYSGDNSWA